MAGRSRACSPRRSRRRRGDPRGRYRRGPGARRARPRRRGRLPRSPRADEAGAANGADGRQRRHRRQPDVLGPLALPPGDGSPLRSHRLARPLGGGWARPHGAVPGLRVGDVRPLHGCLRGLVLSLLHGYRRVRLRRAVLRIARRHRLPRPCQFPTRRCLATTASRSCCRAQSASSSATPAPPPGATPSWSTGPRRPPRGRAGGRSPPSATTTTSWTGFSRTRRDPHRRRRDGHGRRERRQRPQHGGSPRRGGDVDGDADRPGAVGIWHDHYISFRLDLDVDGQANSFVRERLAPRAANAGTPRRSLWAPERIPMPVEGAVEPATRRRSGAWSTRAPPPRSATTRAMR